MLLLSALHALSKIGDTLNSTKIVGYFRPSLESNNFTDLNGDQLTHVLYAFATIYRDGTITFKGYGNNIEWESFALTDVVTPEDEECPCGDECVKGQVNQLIRLRREYPHIRTILSVGGWTWSHNLSIALSTNASRQRAMETGTALMNKYAFDGLDIDWEFPTTDYRTDEPDYTTSPDDFKNLADFFVETRAYWKEQGLPEDQILSTALPASLKHFQSALDHMDVYNEVLSFAMIMTYEYHHNRDIVLLGAPLNPMEEDSEFEKEFNVVNGMRDYPLDKSKIVMGIPLYATGFDDFQRGTGNRNLQCLGDNLNSPSIIAPISYKKVLAMANEEFGGYETSPERAQSVICNDSVFYSFDTVETIPTKMAWLKEEGYGGIMLWDLSQDVLDEQYSLLNASYTALGFEVTKDRSYQDICLNQTDYCNLRCDYTEE